MVNGINATVPTQLDRAKQLYRGGQHRASAEILHEILAKDSGNVEAKVLLGIICTKAERFEEAERHLRTALQLETDHRDALIWLAITKKSQQDFDEAIRLCEQAIRIEASALTFNTLGVCLLSKREPKAATAAFNSALRCDPTSGATYQNLGLALRMDERRFEALDAFKKALELAPENPGNWLEVCEQLQRLSRWTDAIVVAKQGLQKFPNVTAFMIFLANAYSVIKQPALAEEMFKKAMELKPSTSQSYAQWLLEEGRFEESLSCLAQSVRLKPIQGYAYYCLAESKRFELDGESWLESAASCYTHPSLRTKDRMFLDYAIGIASESQKDYERAMFHFDRACGAAFKIYNEGRPFDFEAGIANLDRKINLYNSQNIAKLQEQGSDDQTPILIVGMIRSGTTLLEQIISSHPQVKAAGELVYWILESDRLGKKWSATGIDSGDLPKVAADYLYVLETMGGRAPRITDKMPLNYEHLGLIHAVFPKAKILHIRRNPLDTCLSVYTTHYGAGPNFAYRQENIVAYYRGYLRLMEHWRNVLPTQQFYELDYEDLVVDRDKSTRDLIEFLELPWDEACLHHEDNSNAITTPSRWQARQPIYSTSVQKWKHYEPYLGALLELRDLSHPTPSRSSLTR